MYSLYGYRQEPHLTETVESQARRQLEWLLPQERSLASHREASAALEERTPRKLFNFFIHFNHL